MLIPAEDASGASWIVESLHSFAQDVGSVVPPIFEVYLRLFHPAWVGGEEGHPVTWNEVANANGRTAHPEMQFHALVPEGFIDGAGNMVDQQWGLWESPPGEGSLDRDISERLLPVLRQHTRTPERCWFAFWDGWGIPVPLKRRKGFVSRVFSRPETYDREALKKHGRWQAPTFSIPGRDLLLFTGSLDDALEGFYEHYEPAHFQSPYFWWPEDRAWCVATEIDFMSTYIGASDACVEAILRTPDIEALPASVDDRITGDADTINLNPLTRG
jgi:hypothetical protein